MKKLFAVAVFLTLSFGGMHSLAMGAVARPTAAPGDPAEQRVHRLGHDAFGSNSPINYYNWSGFAAGTPQPFTAVESSFVQPSVTCPVANAWTVFWVGFDGFQNGTVEQAGTGAACEGAGSTPRYFAWWEMYPTNGITALPLTVTPGDKIHATVTYVASSASYVMTVKNNSTAQSATQTAKCASNLNCWRESAEWIVERPSGAGYFPLADWNKMKLATDKAGTGTVAKKPEYRPTSAFSNIPIDMVNYPYTGRTLAAVSGLNATGTAFSDTWLAAE